MIARVWTAALAAALLLCTAARLPAAAAEDGDEGFAEELQVSPRTALVLSALVPGLGQMASGHKVKGGAVFFTELLLVTVAVDAHESYKTRLEVYEESLAAYHEQRVGGSWVDAEARYRQLRADSRDLDGLHRRRLAFAYPALALYLANLVDVALQQGGSGDGARARATLDRGTPGLQVYRRLW